MNNCKIVLNKFDWDVSPYYKLHLFDPDKPLYYDTGIKLFTSYNFRPWLNLNATIWLSNLKKTINYQKKSIGSNEVNSGSSSFVHKVTSNLNKGLDRISPKKDAL